jgi:hypothetical protein
MKEKVDESEVCSGSCFGLANLEAGLGFAFMNENADDSGRSVSAGSGGFHCLANFEPCLGFSFMKEKAEGSSSDGGPGPDSGFDSGIAVFLPDGVGFGLDSS